MLELIVSFYGKPDKGLHVAIINNKGKNSFICVRPQYKDMTG